MTERIQLERSTEPSLLLVDYQIVKLSPMIYEDPGSFTEAVEMTGIVFKTPVRPKGTKGFAVEAKCWMVERMFAWLNFFRRVVIDYEHTAKNAVSLLLLANLTMVIRKIDFLEIYNF